VSTELLGGWSGRRATGSARRSALALAALARARGLAVPAAGVERRGGWLAAVAAVIVALRGPARARVTRHLGLCVLVALILGGEGLGGLSGRAGELRPVEELPQLSAGGADYIVGLVAPAAIAPIKVAGSAPAIEPASSRPREVASAYKAWHELAAGETLGEVAARYGVGLDTLVLANGLERGDALIAGQLLRIPYVAGLPHLVAAGETVGGLAERFAVPVEQIALFPANQVGASLELRPGSELFIPGARRELPADWLQALGGMDGLAARSAEPAGVVRAGETNMRTGPSTEHERVAQLEAGRRLILRARHEEWLQVQLGAERGWVRADMLDAPPELLESLPLTNDFPAPPPRWVWPARGTITSRYGPRWGSFHNGLDIANRAWTPIVAARTGLVKEAGWCSGYGYCVKLVHDGGMETVYGHLIDQPTVSRGDKVTAGELIGHMGSTYDRAGGGYSTGVHLHLTVLVNGKAVDPLRFLP
jgi:murein DD-endopeptidase MepM/ murein hydrolase activator NlpD